MSPLFTDPVMLRCGHNFCRGCIDRVLDSQEGSGHYSCPHCREKGSDRLTLHRNITLDNITEHFRSAQPDQEEPIVCTYCLHSSVPAIKACLTCEASLCEEHLKVHSKGPEHVLCAPTTPGDSRRCSIHKKVLEHYCTEDSTCICASCCLDGEHKGHKLETLDEAYEKRKTSLNNVLQKLLAETQEAEKRVQTLQELRRITQGKSNDVAKRVTALFRDLRKQLEALERRILSNISRQTDQVTVLVSDVIQELEIKNNEVSVKRRHIEKLCKSEDPLTVLQESGDLCDMDDGNNEDRERHYKQLRDGGDLDVAGISHTLHTGLADIMSGVTGGIYICSPEYISLDEKTSANGLHISRDKKTASCLCNNQIPPDSPERFQYNQVMSIQSFSSGRHYWEVDVGGSESWRVGMCYPSIARKGYQSQIGHNSKSWCLCRAGDQYSMMHDKKYDSLPIKTSIDRVRIFLDYENWRLSFYDLGVPIRHLHTFTATFIEPLHASINVCSGSVKVSAGVKEF
ncbi:E3 ubiquitin/ISG15 ligase TRIM25-like [Hyperolius riggenbachi]|uniref:E3 ubiquitin/ISG15 ligase TRIM25-like n=1 Tax=Hyperolius riggenbachi TaxID=752182 RepID=UPI0035A2C9C3